MAQRGTRNENTVMNWCFVGGLYWSGDAAVVHRIRARAPNSVRQTNSSPCGSILRRTTSDCPTVTLCRVAYFVKM
jgi:hypothetical protein